MGDFTMTFEGFDLRSTLTIIERCISDKNLNDMEYIGEMNMVISTVPRI